MTVKAINRITFAFLIRISCAGPVMPAIIGLPQSIPVPIIFSVMPQESVLQQQTTEIDSIDLFSRFLPGVFIGCAWGLLGAAVIQAKEGYRYLVLGLCAAFIFCVCWNKNGLCKPGYTGCSFIGGFFIGIVEVALMLQALQEENFNQDLTLSLTAVVVLLLGMIIYSLVSVMQCLKIFFCPCIS